MNFTQICKTLIDLGSISGTNAKIEFIQNHNDDQLKEVYKWLFDSSRISGIAEKKIDKKVDSLFGDFTTCDIKEITDVFRYLDSHNTGSDEDISNIQWYMNQICKDDSEKEIFKKIV